MSAARLAEPAAYSLPEWAQWAGIFATTAGVLLALGVALWTQWSATRERRRVFELSVLVRLIESIAGGELARQGVNLPARLLDVLPSADMPRFREWLSAEHRVDLPADDVVRAEYQTAVARRL